MSYSFQAVPDLWLIITYRCAKVNKVWYKFGKIHKIFDLTLYFIKFIVYNMVQYDAMTEDCMANQKRDEMKDYLFRAILSLESVDDCYHFFDDLCTIKELGEMAKRICGAKMLDENRVYTEITEKTGLSTATISRINRCLKYGSNGYAEVIAKLDAQGIKPPAELGLDEKADGGNDNA